MIHGLKCNNFTRPLCFEFQISRWRMGAWLSIRACAIQRKLRERVSWSSGPKTKSDRMIPACGRFSIEYSITHSNVHILYDMIAYLQLCPHQYPLKIFVNIWSLSRIWVHNLQLRLHTQSIKQVGTLLSRTIHLSSLLTITRKKNHTKSIKQLSTVLRDSTIVSTSTKE